MNTRRRLDLLAHAYPRLFPRAELLRLLREQLGDVDALDQWTGGLRARAPRLIYHICAGNLAVSAMTSIAHGLLLGARNVVKLPRERENTNTRREILDFVRGLPLPLREKVRCHSQLDETVLREADAVIAFGSDATMTSLREKVRWDQKFVAHGHAVSLLWMPHPQALTARESRACAIDILTYDQLGCLSPQAIYLPSHVTAVGDQLARALEKEWQRRSPLSFSEVAGIGSTPVGCIRPRAESGYPAQPGRPLGVAARIVEARDMARALGHRLWLPPKGHLGWTVIHDPVSTFSPSPLHGIIYLRQSSAARLTANLAPVQGRLSTVGVAGGRAKSSSRWEEAFLSLGVSRFCPAGRMQFPPLTWHHDGRGPLADLVTWIDREETS